MMRSQIARITRKGQLNWAVHPLAVRYWLIDDDFNTEGGVMSYKSKTFIAISGMFLAILTVAHPKFGWYWLPFSVLVNIFLTRLLVSLLLGAGVTAIIFHFKGGPK